MKPEQLRSFEKGTESLEDLKNLLDSNLYLFIDQALHHINALKSELERKDKGLEGFEELFTLVSEKVKSYLEKRLLSNDNLNALSFQLSEDLTYSQWNQLFKIIPEITAMIDRFKFYQSLKFSVSSSKIRIQGFVDSSSWDNSLREFAYSMTRAMLKHQIIMCFSVAEENDQEILELDLDICSGKQNHFLEYSFNDTNINLCLPDFLSPYKTEDLDLVSQASQLFFILNEDLNLIQTDKFPAQYLSKQDETSIFFFPFLFRPLSIIIPRRGSKRLTDEVKGLFEETSARIATDAGWIYKDQNSSKTFFLLDFFAIFNK